MPSLARVEVCRGAGVGTEVERGGGEGVVVWAAAGTVVVAVGEVDSVAVVEVSVMSGAALVPSAVDRGTADEGAAALLMVVNILLVGPIWIGLGISVVESEAADADGPEK